MTQAIGAIGIVQKPHGIPSNFSGTFCGDWVCDWICDTDEPSSENNSCSASAGQDSN